MKKLGNRYEFDEATFLSAFAVGEPGKRTFFVAVGKKGQWVRLWLEKQDLQALAIAIRRLLFNLSQNHVVSSQRAEVEPPPDAPSKLPTAELEIHEMTLGYDDGKAVLEASVHQLGPQKTPGELHCRATLAQLRQLGNQADSVCAAGRPICPLCGGPIDPTGHDCPAKN